MVNLDELRLKHNPLVAVSFIRFSSEDPRREGIESIETQQQVISDFAKKNDIVILREYFDNTPFDAETTSRDALQKLMTDLNQKDFVLILVHDILKFAPREIDSDYFNRLVKNGVILLDIEEYLARTYGTDDTDYANMLALIDAFMEYEEQTGYRFGGF
jgi:DNA invertase Pin-like site-specific DNA recombinase